jgi:hypothetical protein
MLKELNFELTYDIVQNSPEFSYASKISLSQALIDRYEQMQADICRKDWDNWLWASSACRTFLSLFTKRGDHDGLVFTLNKDLFLEQYYARDMGNVVMPGIEYPNEWFRGNAVNPLGTKNLIRLPRETDLIEAKSGYQQPTHDGATEPARRSSAEAHGSAAEYRARESHLSRRIVIEEPEAEQGRIGQPRLTH